MSNLFSDDSIKDSFYTPNSLRRKNEWLVILRWVALAAAALYVTLICTLLPDEYPLQPMILTTVVLGLVNLMFRGYLWIFPPKTLESEKSFVLTQIILDFFILTSLIHFSGGIESPFFFFYVFHIIITSTIFNEFKQPLVITLVAILLYTTMVVLEQLGLIKSYGNIANSDELITVIMTLAVFYVTLLTSAYLGFTLMKRHRKVKDLIFAQNYELEKTDKEKSQFFRFVSHELKSPIIATQSAINVVLDRDKKVLTPMAVDMLTRASNRSEQMLDIVKDLVDLSYDRPILDHKPDLVIPCDYLNAFIDEQRPRMEEKHIELVIDICKEREKIKLDKFILEKIFSNLLSNAIRYTKEGGKVSVKTTIDEKYWSFYIQDTGIGISKDSLKKVFTEFYRAKNAKQFAAVGTGLGLSIVKKLVEQSGGKIELKSNVDEGTAVTVRFPL